MQQLHGLRSCCSREPRSSTLHWPCGLCSQAESAQHAKWLFVTKTELCMLLERGNKESLPWWRVKPSTLDAEPVMSYHLRQPVSCCLLPRHERSPPHSWCTHQRALSTLMPHQTEPRVSMQRCVTLCRVTACPCLQTPVLTRRSVCKRATQHVQSHRKNQVESKHAGECCDVSESTLSLKRLANLKCLTTL